jgi:hypothetical protein
MIRRRFYERSHADLSRNFDPYGFIQHNSLMILIDTVCFSRIIAVNVYIISSY